MGHFKGAAACKSPKSKGNKVRAVDGTKDSSGEETDGMVGRVMEDRKEMVRAAFDKAEPRRDARATVSIIALDKGRPSQDTSVSLLIDSGVFKTLLSEKDWRKVKQKPGESCIKLKKCRTTFRPFGTEYQLPILGRTKCIMQAAAGAQVATIVYVVKGETQSLLGLWDSEKLGIIKVNPEGEKVEVVSQLSWDEKLPSPTEGRISGGQTAVEIEWKMVL